nr:mannonate dehydratase [Anaerotruncus rubiinfantis]
MKMTFRWYGKKEDPIPLSHIRQIPGIVGPACMLNDIPAGDAWPLARILELKSEVNAAGMAFKVIDGVNIREDIKLGLPSREEAIENYRQTIRNAAEAGVEVIVYPFTPVFEWIRTDLGRELPDGSRAMSYDPGFIQSITDPQQLADHMLAHANGFSLAGWEPERIANVKRLMALYRDITTEDVLQNLIYFLREVIPTCEECGVKLALHPDDPPWDVLSVPRVVINFENMKRVVEAVDSPCNGLCLCTGSLGENPENDVPAIVRYFAQKQRISYMHIRNVRFAENGVIDECSHKSSDGNLNMYEIMKALVEEGYDGYARPDHGRMIWGERGRPGYGLYDRALGVAYLNGLTEALENHVAGR